MKFFVISITTILLLAVGAVSLGQAAGDPPAKPKPAKTNGGLSPEEKAALQVQKKEQMSAQEYQRWLKSITDAESNGVEVRIKDIARFRGIRANQLLGYGLVVGLDGSGDTKNTPFTQTLLANAMKIYGTVVDPTQLKVKNVAVVAVTAELPAFAMPGNTLDVTVQSIGDAKSLQGGTLLQAPLYAATKDTVYAVAQGPISIGGFNVGTGGNSVQKNHTLVGRVPSGGIVENMVQTKTVFDNNKMYLELDDADMTTAQRIAEKLQKSLPQFNASADTPGTIQLTLPTGMSPVQAMSEIELVTVYADIPAVVVINERTGTIVAGGNVRLGPAMIAKGSLSVKIETEYQVSQPPPFSKNGETVVVPQTTVTAGEERPKVTMVAPITTVSDLAKLFQRLKVSATDIIAILQGLQQQGALKARIKIQ